MKRYQFTLVELLVVIAIIAILSATLLPVVQGICNLLGDTPEERAAKKALVIQSLVYGSMICGMFIMTAHLPNMILVGIF